MNVLHRIVMTKTTVLSLPKLRLDLTCLSITQYTFIGNSFDMQSNSFLKRYQKSIKVIVSYGFVILFLYAAFSKLLDFETFTVQLAQSPLLSAYAGIIAWAVPGLEILIALFLTIPKFRLPALYASFTLMVMFTAYIYIILNFSDFVPCSCGGVLEKLSWTQHLILNVVFIILAGVVVFLFLQEKPKKTLLVLAILAIIGISIVALLFAFSEKKMHRNNAFQRRYPHHPANEFHKLDLGFNSYYYGGITQDSLYLGNASAPMHLLALDLDLLDTIHRVLTISNPDLAFRYLQTLVDSTTVYSMDGTVPVIFQGDLANLNCLQQPFKIPQFIKAVPIEGNAFVFRAFDAQTGGNIIGQFSLDTETKIEYYPNILQAKGDAFFDTDGILLYNKQLQKTLYVYFYRNEYDVANRDFSLDYRGRTIDTISVAQLDVRTIETKNEKKLGKNPIRVNLQAATYGKYLLIQSDRLGKYESEKMLKGASIIDVYNLQSKTYDFSFYLYHPGLEKLKEFRVDGLTLYALVDHYLIEYLLDKNIFNIDSKI